VDSLRALKVGIVAATLIALAGALGVGSYAPTTAVAGTPTRPAVPIGDADGDGDVDLDDLIKRIKDSNAVGLLTKISLKRDIDVFKGDLKAVHDGASKSTLVQLHERYDLMVHKLISALQAKDPGLAREISESRNYLWSKLADPNEFRRM
jgi:hypothetical protein